MTIARIVLLTAGCLVAAACGKTAQLQPARGQSLPVKPLLAKATPTAEQLLELPTNARPERVDELIKRSQPRQPDRFDLPPPGPFRRPRNLVRRTRPASRLRNEQPRPQSRVPGRGPGHAPAPRDQGISQGDADDR